MVYFSSDLHQLIGKLDSNTFLDEFEFVRVSCPWVLKKPVCDIVRPKVTLILMRSASNCQVSRKEIHHRKKFILWTDRINHFEFELRALVLKNRFDLVRLIATLILFGTS